MNKSILNFLSMNLSSIRIKIKIGKYEVYIVYLDTVGFMHEHKTCCSNHEGWKNLTW